MPRLGLPPLGRVPSCHRRPYSLPGAGSSVAGGTSLTAHLRRRAASCSPAPRAASGPSDDLSDNWLTALPSRSLTRGAMTSLRPAARGRPPSEKIGVSSRSSAPPPAGQDAEPEGGGRETRTPTAVSPITDPNCGAPRRPSAEERGNRAWRTHPARSGPAGRPAKPAPTGQRGRRPGWRAAPSVQRASGLS